MENRIWLFSTLFFIFLLALPLQGFAHGVDENEAETSEEDSASHGEHEEEECGHEEDEEHGKEDGHKEDKSHGKKDDHKKGDDHAEDDDHYADGHTHDYEEVGANLPLIGTFAAINGSFILFGAIRKVNRKRKSGVK